MCGRVADGSSPVARWRFFVGSLHQNWLRPACYVPTVRIASLNTWGGAMYPELAEWLSTSAVDVIYLQEVTATPGLSGWTTFTDGERTLPQRANLLADLRTLLPQHQPLFVTSDAGPVTDADGRRHRQAFGLATFV